MTTKTEFATRDIAKAIAVAPRTKKFVLRDEFGLAYDGRRYTHVLGALANSDRSDLPGRVHTVAYALLKSMSTGRMNAVSASRIADYSPYRMCSLVARIANDCTETTIGGICDGWIAANHASF